MVSFKFVAKDGMLVLFREPRSGDAPELMRFINAFVPEKRSGILINKKVDLKSEKAWVKGWLADIRQRKGVMLLVESEGMILGNCTVNRLLWKSSHGAELGIALSREIRGKGVGEALMNRTIVLAKKRMRGLEMFHIKAFAYNERALGLYKRIGFVEVGRVPKANKEGSEYHDDVLMVKYL